MNAPRVMGGNPFSAEHIGALVGAAFQSRIAGTLNEFRRRSLANATSQKGGQISVAEDLRIRARVAAADVRANKLRQARIEALKGSASIERTVDIRRRSMEACGDLRPRAPGKKGHD